MPALNGHMRLHGGYNNTRADLEQHKQERKQNRQSQQQSKLSQSIQQHQQNSGGSQQSSSKSAQHNQQLQHQHQQQQQQQQQGPPSHSVPLSVTTQLPPRMTLTELSSAPPSLTIPSVPLSSLAPSQFHSAGIHNVSPPQRPIVKQEPLTPLTQLPSNAPQSLPSFPGYLFPQSSQPQGMLIPQSQYMHPVYNPQPPIAQQPSAAMFISQMNRVQAGTPPRPPSNNSAMSLPRLVPSLEPQGGTAPMQQTRQGRMPSPFGMDRDRDPSPPKLEAIRPQMDTHHDRFQTNHEAWYPSIQANHFNQPMLPAAADAHWSQHQYDGNRYPPAKPDERLPQQPSKLEQALRRDELTVKTERIDSNGGSVFRNPPPVNPSPTKKKPRPTPLHIPSCVSTGTPGGIIPGTYQSQMRSPREMGVFYHGSYQYQYQQQQHHRTGTTPPPYTPPPMLSPIRSGSGLYFNVGATGAGFAGATGVTPKPHPPLTPGLISMHRRSTGGE